MTRWRRASPTRYGWLRPATSAANSAPYDTVKAVDLLRRAADSGELMAMAQYAFAINTGRGGLTRDNDKTIDYLRRAADAGLEPAQLTLARWFRDRYVTRENTDLSESIKWFERSWRQGHSIFAARGARLRLQIRAGGALVRHQALVRIAPALRAVQNCLLPILDCACLPRWRRNNAGLHPGLRPLRGCEGSRTAGCSPQPPEPRQFPPARRQGQRSGARQEHFGRPQTDPTPDPV